MRWTLHCWPGHVPIPLAEMTTLASRYSQGFMLRHGWADAPDLTDLPGIDPNQGLGSNPTNRPMRILLA